MLANHYSAPLMQYFVLDLKDISGEDVELIQLLAHFLLTTLDLIIRYVHTLTFSHSFRVASLKRFIVFCRIYIQKRNSLKPESVK